MKFNDDQVRDLCTNQLALFAKRCEQLQLNGGSQARILGISRSRWTQIQSGKSPAVLTATPFLNLIWALDALEVGAREGWLPAGSPRGKAQQTAVDRLQALADE